MKVIEAKKLTTSVACTGNGNNASGCGSTLEIEKSDIRFYRGKSGDPSRDGTFFYAAPAATIRRQACGCLTDLTKKQRPSDFEKCTPITSAWMKGADRMSEVEHLKKENADLCEKAKGLATAIELMRENWPKESLGRTPNSMTIQEGLAMFAIVNAAVSEWSKMK